MAEPHVKSPLELNGESLSPGLAMGEAYLLKHINLDAVEKNRFPVEDMATEFDRLDQAVRKSISQLREVIRKTAEENVRNVRDIFTAQISLLEDVLFLERTKSIVQSQNANIEHVLAKQIREVEEQFAKIEDSIMKARLLDILDVHHRLLRNLLEIEHVRTNPVSRVLRPVIFVSEKLLPSDLVLLEKSNFKGLIVEKGSRSSHVAIIARSLALPAVSNVPGITALIKNGDILIVDGSRGKILIHPAAADVTAFRRKSHTAGAKKKDGEPIRNQVCRTKDGMEIRVEANAGSIEEVKLAFASGADGIGLLRSEFFYLSRQARPAVDEETEYYRQIFKIMHKRPVTVRLLDLGADKMPSYLNGHSEDNPQLGSRGIRFLLKNPDLFKNHLMSILPLAREHRVKLLLPFVSIVEDVESTLSFIDQLCRENGFPRKNIRTGIMVEIPSAAMAIESFIRRIDFISVGTNDLVQYMFAASRDEGDFDEYRQAFHPVILQLLKNVAETARRHKKEITVCGEIASDPAMAELLVGLGIGTLSVPGSAIPAIKRLIREISQAGAKHLADSLLVMDKAEEVRRALKSARTSSSAA